MSVALERGCHKQRVRKHRVLLESASDVRSAHMPPRQHPNILVTGTPGTGKTTHCELIASEADLRHVNVGDIVKEHDLHDGYSNEFDAYYIDDDKVNDHLEDIMADGGIVIDHHSSDLFPERFFDLVIVLQTDNTVLFDRLKARGYTDKKLQENIECEIMHVPSEEAHRSYNNEIVQVLSSNDPDEMEANVERVVEWVRRYRVQHKPTS
eukprot:jgi/Ulvmu1/838/UM010_0212.1